MGFGDKLKDLRDQAQQAVSDNREKIQGAVQSVGEAANARTGGRYADKIERVGEKVNAGVDRIGGASADTETKPTTPTESDDGPASGSPPEFE